MKLAQESVGCAVEFVPGLPRNEPTLRLPSGIYSTCHEGVCRPFHGGRSPVAINEKALLSSKAFFEDR
jgi:hypothetical protein